MKLPDTRTRLLLAAGLLAALAASSARAAAIYRDEVWQRGADKPIIAYIVKDTIDEIKTADGAVFNPMGIERVAYGGAPQSYRDAESYRKTGRLDDAIASYQTALRNLPADRKFWIEPHCRFYIAECYLELEDLKKAEDAYNDLLAKHKDTRFKPNAFLGLGRVKFEAGDHAAAYRRFDDLERFAKGKSWTVWLYEAWVWKARALRMQKRYDEALGYARKVIAAADPRKYEDLIVQARTEEALTYVGKKQYDEGIARLNKLLDRISGYVDDPNPVTAARMRRMEAQCKNALGHCYLARHKQSKKKEDIQEALIAFLWNVTLHPNLPERIEALQNAADCFEKLGQKSRASELRGELEGREGREAK